MQTKQCKVSTRRKLQRGFYKSLLKDTHYRAWFNLFGFSATFGNNCTGKETHEEQCKLSEPQNNLLKLQPDELRLLCVTTAFRAKSVFLFWDCGFRTERAPPKKQIASLIGPRRLGVSSQQGVQDQVNHRHPHTTSSTHPNHSKARIRKLGAVLAESNFLLQQWRWFPSAPEDIPKMSRVTAWTLGQPQPRQDWRLFYPHNLCQESAQPRCAHNKAQMSSSTILYIATKKNVSFFKGRLQNEPCDALHVSVVWQGDGSSHRRRAPFIGLCVARSCSSSNSTPELDVLEQEQRQASDVGFSAQGRQSALLLCLISQLCSV